MTRAMIRVTCQGIDNDSLSDYLALVVLRPVGYVVRRYVRRHVWLLCEQHNVAVTIKNGMIEPVSR